MSNQQKPLKDAFLLNLLEGLNARTFLAFFITLFAIVGISGLSITIIKNGASEDVEKRANLVLNATLPLFGTWVGTVLAYYFAKENFQAAQAATESSQRFVAELNLQANNSSNDLPSMLVETAMIPKSKIFFVSDSNTQLSEIVKSLDDKKIRRLPILLNDGKIRLVYYEDISKYVNSEIAKENLRTPPNLDNIKDLKLQNYLDDNPNTYSNFAIVSPKASLAYAKEAMKLKSPDCRDVFVTEDGKETSPVVGYLTNIDFEKFSRS